MHNPNTESGKSIGVSGLPEDLANFLRVYSIEMNSRHGLQDSEPKGESQQIDLDGPFCACCGRPARFGMFCSMKCEREIFGED
jgi:hypothetical protein